MISTIGLLLQSRKFWIGFLSITAIALSVLLVTLGKIDSVNLVPTITAITAVGVTTIGSIAWEDTAKTKANAQVNSAEAANSSLSAIGDVMKRFAPKIGDEGKKDETKS